MCNRSSKHVGLKVVREASAPVDLHDGKPFPILRLQMLYAADVDLVEVEIELCTERAQLFERALTQMAALRVVDDYLRDKGRA